MKQQKWNYWKRFEAVVSFTLCFFHASFLNAFPRAEHVVIISIDGGNPEVSK